MTFDYSFRQFLDDFARFENTRDLEASRLYQKVRPEIDRVLNQVWQEELAPPCSPPITDSIRAVAWNIERGICLDPIIQLLQQHPMLAGADLLLFSEVDWGMARTGNRFVTREIAAALQITCLFLQDIRRQNRVARSG